MRRSAYPDIEDQTKKLRKFLGYMGEADHTPREAAAMTLDLLASFKERGYFLEVWKETFRTEVLVPLRDEEGHTYSFPDYKQALEEGSE